MKTYGFLKAAKVIFMVLAWLALALGVIVGLIILITGGGPVLAPTAGTVPGAPTAAPVTRAAGVVFLIIGGIYFLILFTVSEIIGLLLDIKADCKKSA